MKPETIAELSLLIERLKLDCLVEQKTLLKQNLVASECFERISKNLIALQKMLLND